MKRQGIAIGARVSLWIGLLLVSIFAPSGFTAAAGPGRVDSSPLIELVGEDALSVEINLSGALLRALTGFDPELAEVAARLDSIQAVIMEPEGKARTQIKEWIGETKRDLTREGWQVIATVREEGSVLNVLTLTDGETIQGLLVLVLNSEEGTVVFANVAGILDLAAIEKLGRELDIPGLDELTDE